MKEKFRTGEKHVPLILLLFTLLAYAPLAGQMGFYWDDWPMLWFKIAEGVEGFAQAFTSDRPFLGNLYKATALLSNDPLLWQVGTVLLRWAVTLAFWWMLKQLWPKREREVFLISLLLSVYPGFKQMPIVYVWLNAFIMLLAYILSYGMMLKAVSSRSRKAYLLWTIPSVLLYTFCTISTEYYTGLDICRGIILWIYLSRRDDFRTLSVPKKIGKVLLHWLPYLGVLGTFMIWRIFIFRFPSYQPVLLSELQQNPLKAVLSVIARIFEDAYTASWGAWTQNFRFPNDSDFAAQSGKLFWIAAAAALIAALAVILRFRSKDESEDRSGDVCWGLTALGLGAAMIIFPGLPYWVTSLPIRLSYPYDRFLVAFMFGSCVFMTGLIELIFRNKPVRGIVFALFIAMAVGGDILNANSYRKDWQMQKDFVDQLTTRIPSLKDPTLLLADNNPLTYESDNSLTGLVNLALDPTAKPDHTIPYMVNLFTPRFKTIEYFESLGTIYEDFRSSLFAAKQGESVVFFYSPPGCLRIIDPEQHYGLPILPDSYKEFMFLSDPKGRISSGKTSTFLQENIFKQDTAVNWCSYFQQADLARQSEDWEAIAALGDEVLPLYQAKEASEYLIFVEAYAHLDRWDDAAALMEKIHTMDKNLDSWMCKKYQDMFWSLTPEDEVVFYRTAAALNRVGCSAFGD